MRIDRHDTDILILGTGGAGMFAALHAQQSAPPGTRITIAVKGLIGKCGCTRMVQGGYNVALGPGDTCNAGALMCEQEFGIGPALILFADAILDWDANIGQPDFIDFVTAINGHDWAHFNAGRFHIDQNE